MHITGKNGNTTSVAGTDILSAAGTASGYAEYTGGFEFADSLTSLIVEIGGRDINLAVGPMFDDVTINVLYNVVSQIVLQSITTVEQYVLHNDGATDTEIEIVKDIFDNNIPVEQPDGNLDFEPIDGGDTNEDSYESVELELDMDFEMDLEMPEIKVEFDMPDIEVESSVTAVDVETEMEVEVVEVAAVEPEPKETTSEPEPQKETVKQEPESKSETETQKEEEVKEESTKKETKPEPKKEETKKPVTKVAKKKATKPKTKAQKKEAKEKAGSKIIKKMGDKGRYDSANQLKTLIVMQVLGDTKEFFSAQKMLPDIQGFFTSGVVPDAEIKDNNFASFMLTGKSHVSMNALIDLQYK